MTELPEEPQPGPPTDAPTDALTASLPQPPEPAALRGEVVRQATAPVVRRRLPRDLAVVRERLAQLAQNPAAVAAATVATTLAVNAVREVVKSGALARRPAPTPVALTVVHHVHVIHSVVHHHVVVPGRPTVLPPPPPH